MRPLLNVTLLTIPDIDELVNAQGDCKCIAQIIALDGPAASNHKFLSTADYTCEVVVNKGLNATEEAKKRRCTRFGSRPDSRSRSVSDSISGTSSGKGTDFSRSDVGNLRERRSESKYSLSTLPFDACDCRACTSFCSSRPAGPKWKA